MVKDLKIDKRTRLIEAAHKLIQQRGFNQTSLADIALESGGQHAGQPRYGHLIGNRWIDSTGTPLPEIGRAHV